MWLLAVAEAGGLGTGATEAALPLPQDHGPVFSHSPQKSLSRALGMGKAHSLQENKATEGHSEH